MLQISADISNKYTLSKLKISNVYEKYSVLKKCIYCKLIIMKAPFHISAIYLQFEQPVKR